MAPAASPSSASFAMLLSDKRTSGNETLAVKNTFIAVDTGAMCSDDLPRRCSSEPILDVSSGVAGKNEERLSDCDDRSTISGGFSPRSAVEDWSPQDDDVCVAPVYNYCRNALGQGVVSVSPITSDPNVAEAFVGEIEWPLIVKNTFIAVDKAAGMPELTRPHSSPARAQSYDAEAGIEISASAMRCTQSEDMVEAEPAPPAPELVRVSTADSFGTSDSFSVEIAQQPNHTVHSAAEVCTDALVSSCDVVESPVPSCLEQQACNSRVAQPAFSFAQPSPFAFASLGMQVPWPVGHGHCQQFAAVTDTHPGYDSFAKFGLPDLTRIHAIQRRAMVQTPESDQAQGLDRFACPSTGACCVRWTVDARKLRSNDRFAVSPSFDLTHGSSQVSLPFKLVINPKLSNEGRSGASFRVAKGQGSVQLKCEATREKLANAQLTFWLSAGSGRGLNALRFPRGPVQHDFSQSGVRGLARGQDMWDFNSLLDEATQSFVVCLTVQAPWS